MDFFWDDVPVVDVMVSLERSSSKSGGRRFQANDLPDMAFISAALRYANVIVLEKYWQDRLTQSKLAERYETRVTRYLADIPALLEV